MPIGSASIKRASGAINKKDNKSKKAAFSYNHAIIDLEVAKIKFEAVSFDIDALKKSIKKYGMLHPVFVLREGDDFVLVSGKSRMTAAVELGLSVVPAVVLSMDGTGVLTAKKDIFAKKKVCVATEEIAVTSDIHEEKFNVINSIGSNLPDYLL